MTDLLVLGGGGHARVVMDLLRQLGHEPKGYVAPTAAPPLLGVPYYGTDDDLLARDPRRYRLALGLGAVRPDGVRRRVAERFTAHGCEFPPLASPQAFVAADVEVGPGTVVCHGATIVTGTRIGRHCLVNTAASIDHECRLDDFAIIAPGATICGGVRVGREALVGPGATVVEGLEIGAGCHLGAGAVAVRSCDVPGLYLGVPARKVE